ncbi:hypothetical protein B2J86_14380 [Acidovorax sp. SRB_14]|nr:hypothetical protein [Acidovorax sp. SRB_14]
MHQSSCHKILRCHWGTAVLGACMALGLLAMSEGAHAARQKKTTDATTSKAAKKHGAVKVKHQRSPSEETSAERDRRLYRECKGLPNAGACRGYTQR